ncbi:hypothetical protein UlMin_037541 [Ulmus minor]
MGDSSASYIHMVQHLIENCLIFRMSKEECMEALSKHADINHVITSTDQIRFVLKIPYYLKLFKHSGMEIASWLFPKPTPPNTFINKLDQSTKSHAGDLPL